MEPTALYDTGSRGSDPPPILANLPASSLQQCRHTAMAVTAVLTGKLDDDLHEHVHVFVPDGTVALGAAWLVDQLARSPLPHPCFYCAWPTALRRRSGLEVSRDDALPHQLVQAQVSHQSHGQTLRQECRSQETFNSYAIKHLSGVRGYTERFGGGSNPDAKRP